MTILSHFGFIIFSMTLKVMQFDLINASLYDYYTQVGSKCALL